MRATIPRMRDRAVQRMAMAWVSAVWLVGCSMIVDPNPGPEPLAGDPDPTNPCRCAAGSYGVPYCNAAQGSFGGCRDAQGDPCERRSLGDAGRGGDDSDGERSGAPSP